MQTQETQDQLNHTVSEIRTRSGRVSKPPVRYEPIEQVEDDYAHEDYDSEEYEILSDESFDDDDEEVEDEDDADGDGNLEGFVVPDKSESDSESIDVVRDAPVSNRNSVKKRPGTFGDRVGPARGTRGVRT